LEDVLRAASRVSTLDDELERLSDDTRFVEMLALTRLRELSMLADELES
jgi:hypothetical protein